VAGAEFTKGIIAMSALASRALKLLQKVPTGKGANWVEIVSFD
jgi:hypothetical protein